MHKYVVFGALLQISKKKKKIGVGVAPTQFSLKGKTY